MLPCDSNHSEWTSLLMECNISLNNLIQIGKVLPLASSVNESVLACICYVSDERYFGCAKSEWISKMVRLYLPSLFFSLGGVNLNKELASLK